MVSFDLQRMLLGELPLTFLLEVACRVLAAFLAVFLFLKSSGRRGIKQLSRFELVVILTLGSAAGDVTFYEDVPLLPVALVFLTLLLLYRGTVYLMTRSKACEAWIDGLPITVVKDGMYEIHSLRNMNISSNELFMELRQQGVEHLGQVRLGLLETDGDLSLYFYDGQDTRAGLSVLPAEHRPEYVKLPAAGVYCCVSCGYPVYLDAEGSVACTRCGHDVWSPALETLRGR
ncbi:DUF421 domain-containing protein [Pseudomonas sp. CM27]|uniref:DUF421 domain-containing protein n=1 Tax=Pseudomonas sp. CM27 TaxID=2738452 RepID=UPI0015546BAA|nr:YetF domain-containing protein [Pseudomonas sp. CM27]NQD73812.1 DUF421 domain-containing protein [Pseudomonas sp. CM27]HEN8798382.1 DUF421 domain-containing protein [Pseudomonas putida]